MHARLRWQIKRLQPSMAALQKFAWNTPMLLVEW
jgi:hypothetical protein